MTIKTPSSLQPDSLPPEDSVEGPRQYATRPNPEKVTPSRQGRFLSAMERRDRREMKKDASSSSDTKETSETEESTRGTIFQFSAVKGLKKEGQLGDALESEGGGTDASSEVVKEEGVPLWNPESAELEALKEALPPTTALGKSKGGGVPTDGLTSNPTEEDLLLAAELKTADGHAPHPTKEQLLLASETVGGQEAAREALRKMEGGRSAVIEETSTRSLGLQPVTRDETAQHEVAMQATDTKKTEFLQAFRNMSDRQSEESAQITTRGDLSKGQAPGGEQLGTPKKTAVPTSVQATFGFVQAGAAEKTTLAKPSEVRATVLEVVRQAIEAIALLKTKDESTITVTIKQPPLFAGATLKIVESSSAKNEFNITFDNLTPEARRIIETQSNQVQLQQSLLEKGYALRNVVIAPEVKFGPTITASLATSTDEQRPGEDARGFDSSGQEGSTARDR